MWAKCTWMYVYGSNQVQPMRRKLVPLDDVTKHFLFYKIGILTSLLDSLEHWNVKHAIKVKILAELILYQTSSAHICNIILNAILFWVLLITWLSGKLWPSYCRLWPSPQSKTNGASFVWFWKNQNIKMYSMDNICYRTEDEEEKTTVW